jgi:hypothetical protein
LSPDRRREAAAQSDRQRDPANKTENEAKWEIVGRLEEAEKKKRNWEDVRTLTALDLKTQEERLDEIGQERDALLQQLEAPAEPEKPAAAILTAAAWMANYARNYFAQRKVPCKRDDALRDCRKEAHCTYRVARAAWNALPPDMKRSPRQSDRALIGH